MPAINCQRIERPQSRRPPSRRNDKLGNGFPTEAPDLLQHGQRSAAEAIQIERDKFEPGSANARGNRPPLGKCVLDLIGADFHAGRGSKAEAVEDGFATPI